MTTTTHPVRSVLALTLCALGTACLTTSGKLGELDEGGDAGMDEGGSEGEGGSISATSTAAGDAGDAGESDGGDPPPACVMGLGESPGRAFDGVKWRNTVADLLGVSSTVSVPGSWAPAYPAPIPSVIDPAIYEAEAAAVAAAVDVLALLDCAPDAALPESDACIETFATELGRLAWRRALESDEVDALVALDPAGGVEDRARLVVETLLSSPRFWTIEESGTPDPTDAGVLVLDAHAIASRLSYFVWNSMPDEQLLARAEAGELSDPTVRAAEVDRMLADPRAARAIGDYWEAVLDTRDLQEGMHDTEIFPQMDADLVAAMREELRRFAADVVLTEGTWSALLSASRSFVNGPLATAVYAGEILGAPPATGALEPVDLDPQRRPGLLTRAAAMARWTKPAYLGFTHRGQMVRERMLCQMVPPPPPGVDTDPFPIDGVTRYEMMELHTADPSCAGCHMLFDPITPGFDNYDPIARWQTDITALGGPPQTGEPTVPVDASGEIVGIADGVFDDRDGLLAILTTAPEVLGCQVQHQLEYAFGRRLDDEDGCMLETLQAGFGASGGNLRQLVYDVVASDAFVRVRPQ